MASQAAQLPPMIFADDFIERVNIAWRIEPGQLDPHNPLLEPKYPWDSASPAIGHGTVLKDPLDGLFKYWGCSVAEDLQYVRGHHQFRLTYAYSEDGVNWVRPELDICSFEGYPRTNIIFDFDSGGRATYASVFIDPEENPDEPYEMFVFRDMYQCAADRVAGFDEPPDPTRGNALYRYRSTDGLHWRAAEGPLYLDTADTLYIHKCPEGGYVAHHKIGVPSLPGGYVPYDVGAGECRIGMRKTSPDGSQWSESVPLMMPDWQDHPGDQIMEVGYYPYDNGIIGVTAIYHAITQTLDLQFAASVDGRNWWRPAPRRACLPLAPLGDYGGGMIWPTRTLVEDGDKLYLYYGALDGLHGDIYAKTDNCYLFHGAFCRAGWDKGRMWGAVPAAGGQTEAQLTTSVQPCTGTLYVNAVTVADGEITAELLDERRTPIPGFTRRESVLFCGDAKLAPLEWVGGTKLPERASVRFYLRKARLYGFAWR